MLHYLEEKSYNQIISLVIHSKFLIMKIIYYGSYSLCIATPFVLMVDHHC